MSFKLISFCTFFIEMNNPEFQIVDFSGVKEQQIKYHIENPDNDIF